MTHTIAIANEKGGVAKTTTTISLGAVLAELGHRVLLIDLDPQANLSLALGVDPAGVQNSSARLLIEGLPLASVVTSTNIPLLDLVPGSSEMGMAERFLTNRKGYETILRSALEKATQPYDYVLLDCPPFLGAVTLNALNSVDLLLIPTQAEYFSIYALRNLMNLIRRVRAQSNPKLTYRLVLTMFDRRNRIHRSLSEQLRTSFTTGVMQTVIEVDTKLRESPIAGVSILQHAPKSRAAAQYHALAQEIIEYVKETTQQPA
jgi:chromosome partitioning protein